MRERYSTYRKALDSSFTLCFWLSSKAFWGSSVSTIAHYFAGKSGKAQEHRSLASVTLKYSLPRTPTRRPTLKDFDSNGPSEQHAPREPPTPSSRDASSVASIP